MKLKNTLILLVLGIAAYIYVFHFAAKGPTTQQRQADGDRLVSVPREAQATIKITNASGVIELRRGEDEHHWFLEAPIKDRADQNMMDILQTAFDSLRSENAVGDGKEDRDKLKEYGLTRPEASVKITGPTGSAELHLGKETPLDTLVYARVEGMPGVQVVSRQLKDLLTKKAADFRNKRLADVTVQQTKRVILKTAQGEIEIARDRTDRWMLVRPMKARADDRAVSDLIANVANARIDSFYGETKEPGTYGLAEPRATLSLTLENTDDPLVLAIGSAFKPEKKDGAAGTPDEFVYVQLSARDSVVAVPKDIEKLLKLLPNDLRDPHLVRFNADAVDRLSIEAPGKEKISLARSLADQWVRKTDKGDQPTNSAAATQLLREFTEGKVQKFVTDTTSDLAPFGLDKPALKIAFSSFSTENTPETRAGERPLSTVLIGKADGLGLYAKLEEEPFIVTVPRDLIAGVWSDPVQWQDLEIFSMKPADITSVEITRSGQPTFSFERDKESHWKLAKGDGVVNQATFGSLVNMLGGLRAGSWFATKSAAESGLDKPSATVVFTTADRKTHKLSIGTATADALGWHAAAEGKAGTFFLRQMHYETIVAPLIEAPKSTSQNAAPVKPDATNPPAPLLPPPAEMPPTTEPPKTTEAPAAPVKPMPEDK